MPYDPQFEQKLKKGATGVRDQGLLKSALARPKHNAVYGEDQDVILLAAIYTAGIVKNHPFVDGSRHTGFLVGILFQRAFWSTILAEFIEAVSKSSQRSNADTT